MSEIPTTPLPRKARRDAKKTVEDMAIPAFINLLQLKVPIWKKSDPNHQNVAMINLSWQSILDDLKEQFSTEDLALLKLDSIPHLKAKLRTLKDSHVRYVKLTNGNGSFYVCKFPSFPSAISESSKENQVLEPTQTRRSTNGVTSSPFWMTKGTSASMPHQVSLHLRLLHSVWLRRQS